MTHKMWCGQCQGLVLVTEKTYEKFGAEYRQSRCAVCGLILATVGIKEGPDESPVQHHR